MPYSGLCCIVFERKQDLMCDLTSQKNFNRLIDFSATEFACLFPKMLVVCNMSLSFLTYPLFVPTVTCLERH